MVGYSQVIEVMAAMVIFSLILTNTNKYLLNDKFVRVENDVLHNGVAASQDILDRAKVLAFDEVTVGGKPKGDILAQITDPNLLGSESGETYYDDIDDFHGYRDSLTYNGSKSVAGTETIYYRKAEVYYVDSTFVTKSSVPTKHKKLVVTLGSHYFSEDVFHKDLFFEGDEMNKASITFSYVKTYY